MTCKRNVIEGDGEGVESEDESEPKNKLKIESTLNDYSHFFAVRERAYELSSNDMQTGKLVLYRTSSTTTLSI